MEKKEIKKLYESQINLIKKYNKDYYDKSGSTDFVEELPTTRLLEEALRLKGLMHQPCRFPPTLTSTCFSRG